MYENLIIILILIAVFLVLMEMWDIYDTYKEYITIGSFIRQNIKENLTSPEKVTMDMIYPRDKMRMDFVELYNIERTKAGLPKVRMEGNKLV